MLYIVICTIRNREGFSLYLGVWRIALPFALMKKNEHTKKISTSKSIRLWKERKKKEALMMLHHIQCNTMKTSRDWTFQDSKGFKRFKFEGKNDCYHEILINISIFLGVWVAVGEKKCRNRLKVHCYIFRLCNSIIQHGTARQSAASCAKPQKKCSI